VRRRLRAEARVLAHGKRHAPLAVGLHAHHLRDAKPPLELRSGRLQRVPSVRLKNSSQGERRLIEAELPG
jgi:hypothetical protein